MPTETDLCGLGMPPMLAAEIGNQPSNLTATGTTQTTAATILSKNCAVTASGGATGAIIPASAKIGSYFNIINVGGTPAKIYVPVGHSFQNNLNGSITFTNQYGLLIMFQYAKGLWVSAPFATP